MTNTELIKAEVSSICLSQKGEVQLTNVKEAFGFAGLMAQAGMLPKSITQEGAVVSIIAGASVGLNPFQAVQGIAVINGRPSIWGDAMTAIVKASGLLEDEHIEYLPSYKDCQGVRVTVKRKGIKTPYVGLFSLTDAKNAGLLGKDVWAKYQTRMLMNRARSFVYRDAFSDVLKGMRSAEEEIDITEAPTPAETGAAIDEPSPVRKNRAVASAIIDIPAEKPQPTAEPVEVVEHIEANKPVEESSIPVMG